MVDGVVEEELGVDEPDVEVLDSGLEYVAPEEVEALFDSVLIDIVVVSEWVLAEGVTFEMVVVTVRPVEFVVDFLKVHFLLASTPVTAMRANANVTSCWDSIFGHNLDYFEDVDKGEK